MVWGLVFQPAFGQFFPDGEFVGWDDQLYEHYDTQMPADRKALFEHGKSGYSYYVSMNLVAEPGTQRKGPPPLFWSNCSA